LSRLRRRRKLLSTAHVFVFCIYIHIRHAACTNCAARVLRIFQSDFPAKCALRDKWKRVSRTFITHGTSKVETAINGARQLRAHVCGYPTHAEARPGPAARVPSHEIINDGESSGRSVFEVIKRGRGRARTSAKFTDSRDSFLSGIVTSVVSRSRTRLYTRTRSVQKQFPPKLSLLTNRQIKIKYGWAAVYFQINQKCFFAVMTICRARLAIF